MLLEEIITVHFDNHTKPVNTLWAKEELLNVKVGGTHNYHLALKFNSYEQFLNFLHDFSHKVLSPVFTSK
jgi:hypothetical protein